MNPKAIKVPFLDLAARPKPFAAAFRKKLDELLKSSQSVLGAELEAFEKEFAAYLGVKHAVGVSNETDSLPLACEATGLKRGEEVIVPGGHVHRHRVRRLRRGRHAPPRRRERGHL